MELRTNDEESKSLPNFLCISDKELDNISEKNSVDLQAYIHKFMEDQENKIERTGSEEAQLLKKMVGNCDTLEQVVLTTVNFMGVVEKSLAKVKALKAMEYGIGDALIEALREAVQEVKKKEKAKHNAG